MVRRNLPAAVGVSLVVGSFSFAATSRSDDLVVVAPWPAPFVAVETSEYKAPAEVPAPATEPDIRKIYGGLVTFGATYVASIAVGAESARAGDRLLLAPVVGPWLDLARRGGCPPFGGCGGDATSRTLIVGDGIFQAIGVLSFIGGYVFPRTRAAPSEGQPAKSLSFLQITPVQYGRAGLGVAVAGTF